MSENSENRARVLQADLRSYAQESFSEKALRLPGLVASFKDVDHEVLEYLVNFDFQTSFKSVTELTVGQGFILPDQTIVHPWAGGFTLVAIDLDGNIIGALANPIGDVYERYSDNLFPYALAKAVQRRLLYDLRPNSSMRNGLSDIDNNQMVKVCMSATTIFLGEALFDGNTRLNLKKLVLGASGCELTAEYRHSLAPGMLGDEGQDFTAGYADMIFAENVASLLNPDVVRANPHLLKQVPEPEFLSLLRIAH